MYGNGRNRRDWIHVIDHCRMVDWVVRRGQVGESYNLGADCELENIDLIHIICKIFDELRPIKKSHAELIQFVADRAGHDFRYAINSSKALAQGCVEPTHDVKASLREMISCIIS